MGQSSSCISKSPSAKYAIEDEDEKELERHAQKGTKAKRRKTKEAKEITARPTVLKPPSTASPQQQQQEQPQANGLKANGVQANGVQSNGLKANGTQANGVKADLMAPAPTPATPTAPTPAANPGSASASAPTPTSPAAAAAAVEAKPAGAATPKPKLNIKDFQFKQCKGEVKVKPPGTINGQAFMIDECVDCDLYVLDNCAAVTIDDSRNCRIFIGPTDGSIFMRNCTNVKCCFIGRQIRLRDVSNSSVAMLCRTKPIVETSTNVAVMCYDLWYSALPGQLKSAKLDAFHNFWDSIHDFTPKPDSWRYLEPELSVSDMMGPIPEEVQAAMGETKHAEVPLVVTWGSRPPPGQGYLMALFPEARAEGAFQLAAHVKAEQAHVLHTNKAVISSQLASELAESAGWPASTKQSITGLCYGMELSGDNIEESMPAKAEALGGFCTTNADAAELFRQLGIEG